MRILSILVLISSIVIVTCSTTPSAATPATKTLTTKGVMDKIKDAFSPKTTGCSTVTTASCTDGKTGTTCTSIICSSSSTAAVVNQSSIVATSSISTTTMSGSSSMAMVVTSASWG